MGTLRRTAVHRSAKDGGQARAVPSADACDDDDVVACGSFTPNPILLEVSSVLHQPFHFIGL